jgi:uncharacterized secreted repeat protein (TIGR03808 family)
MTISRRTILNTSATALVATTATAASMPAQALPLMSALGRDVTQYGVRPGSPDDQTRAVQRAVDEAARAAMPLAFPPGIYRLGALKLPTNAQLVGVHGATTFSFAGTNAFISSQGAGNVAISDIVLDGNGIRLAQRQGLIHIVSGRDVRISGCHVIDSGGVSIWFDSVAGEISGNTIRNSLATAVVSFDAQGLIVTRNTIRGTSDNGIEILRNNVGDDGSIVTDNRVEDIRNGPGGTGQHGNGINAFRAANVIIHGNQIRNCDFSAIRGNSASNIQIVGNSVSDAREVALYSEFSFEGAVIANNTVDRCAVGVSVANFNEGGRMAIVQGNILRNMFTKKAIDNPSETDGGTGMYIEADASVTGNVIENAPLIGIVAGWGRYLRDVAITGNVVRNTSYGIGVSVVPGSASTLVANNVISNATNGAVVGFDHAKAVSGDLTKSGASKYPHLLLGPNQVRPS